MMTCRRVRASSLDEDNESIFVFNTLLPFSNYGNTKIGEKIERKKPKKWVQITLLTIKLMMRAINLYMYIYIYIYIYFFFLIHFFYFLKY